MYDNVKCKDCKFYEEDYVNDDGDWVGGLGCCYPFECPYNKKEKE